MWKKTLIFALLWVLLGCSGTSVPGKVKGVTFKTPEEAITWYFEGITQADARKVLQACAIDEKAAGFRFDLYIEHVGYFLPSTLSPANDPLYVEVNKMQLAADSLNRAKGLLYGLLSDEEVAKEFGEHRSIKMNPEMATAFMNDVDPRRLAQLQVHRIDLPRRKLMQRDSYQKRAARLASIYGADERTERVVLFSFEQNYYYVGFTLLRYGENWKIEYQVSQMAGTSESGVPQKTTVEDYERLLSGD